MIWESHYWKTDLLRDADIIEECSQDPFSEQKQVLIEKKIMISAYAVRKLLEACKLSDHIVSSRADIRVYDPKDSFMTMMNWHKLEKHFHMNHHKVVSKDWRFILNQLIHSFVFLFKIDHNNNVIDFILVSSDRDKSSALYEVAISDWCRFMRVVGTDDPTSFSWSIDPITRKETMKIR